MYIAILLFLIGIATAYWLGSRARPKEEEMQKLNLPKNYLIGLNFLLNEETDKAVDVFIKMLEVDSETVETHLAVGKLFRRRGEVDRAIRIHQNLIARPQLERVYREQALYALGQDYLSAGVLDRAERIFLELVDAKSHAARALSALLDIYQQEKDWQHAVDAALKYQSVTKKNMQVTIAHYYCELADIAFYKQDLEQTLHYLSKSLDADPACVRASLLFAKTYMAKAEYKTALQYLKKIKNQNPDYISEALTLLSSCYEQLQQEQELLLYLQGLAEEYPHLPVILALAERIKQAQGDKEAAQFITDYVRRYPSLKGLSLLVNLYSANVEDKLKGDLQLLQNVIKKVLGQKPDYQCHSCGFSGKSLHWQCPGCKQWGSTASVHSLQESPA